VGVDQVFVGRVGTSIVAKYGLPERHYRRGVGRSGDDQEALDLGRVAGQPN
jgi:hypothetical protein